MLLIFGLNAVITSLGFVVLVWELVSASCSVVPNSLQPHGLQPTRLFCPRDFPGKDPGVGCHFLLRGIFLTQGSNLDLLHCRQIPHHLSYEVWEEKSKTPWSSLTHPYLPKFKYIQNLITFSYFQSFQRILLICHSLKLAGQGLYFTGMITPEHHSPF